VSFAAGLPGPLNGNTNSAGITVPNVSGFATGNPSTSNGALAALFPPLWIVI